MFANGAKLEAFDLNHAPVVNQFQEVNRFARQNLKPDVQSSLQKFINSHLWLKVVITFFVRVLLVGAGVLMVFNNIIYFALGLCIAAVAILISVVLGIEPMHD